MAHKSNRKDKALLALLCAFLSVSGLLATPSTEAFPAIGASQGVTVQATYGVLNSTLLSQTIGLSGQMLVGFIEGRSGVWFKGQDGSPRAMDSVTIMKDSATDLTLEVFEDDLTPVRVMVQQSFIASRGFVAPAFQAKLDAGSWVDVLTRTVGSNVVASIDGLKVEEWSFRIVETAEAWTPAGLLAGGRVFGLGNMSEVFVDRAEGLYWDLTQTSDRVVLDFEPLFNHANTGAPVFFNRAFLATNFNITNPYFEWGHVATWKPLLFYEEPGGFWVNPESFSQIGIHEAATGETVAFLRVLNRTQLLLNAAVDGSGNQGSRVDVSTEVASNALALTLSTGQRIETEFVFNGTSDNVQRASGILFPFDLPPLAIAMGGDQGAVIASDGFVYVWGANGPALGQTTNTPVGQGIPRKVHGGDQGGSFFANASQIAVGNDHVLALTTTGQVWAWGCNEFGQVGVSSPMAGCTGSDLFNAPKRVVGGDQGGTYLENIRFIGAVANVSYAINDVGNVFAWGSGARLGDGSTTSRYYQPQNVEKETGGVLTNVQKLSVGMNETLALLRTGEVYAWGLSELLVGDGAVGTAAYRARQVVGGQQGGSFLTGIADVAGCGSVCVVTTAAGAVYSWGSNTYGQLGIGATSDKQSPQLVNLTGVTKVSSSGDHTLAVLGNASMYAWGRAANGRLGDNQSATDKNLPTLVATSTTAIAAAPVNSLAIRGGVLYSWGANVSGLNLGNGRRYDAIEATAVGVGDTATQYFSSNQATVRAASPANHGAILHNGGVYEFGAGTSNANYAPTQVGGGQQATNNLTNICQLSQGTTHTLALTCGGEIYAWGSNTYGESGAASGATVAQPSKVPQPSGFNCAGGTTCTVVEVYAGDKSSFFRVSETSMRIFGFGSNVYGELSTGSTDSSMHATPVAITFASTVSSGSGLIKQGNAYEDPAGPPTFTRPNGVIGGYWQTRTASADAANGGTHTEYDVTWTFSTRAPLGRAGTDYVVGLANGGGMRGVAVSIYGSLFAAASQNLCSSALGAPYPAGKYAPYYYSSVHGNNWAVSGTSGYGTEGGVVSHTAPCQPYAGGYKVAVVGSYGAFTSSTARYLGANGQAPWSPAIERIIWSDSDIWGPAGSGANGDTNGHWITNGAPEFLQCGLLGCFLKYGSTYAFGGSSGTCWKGDNTNTASQHPVSVSSTITSLAQGTDHVVAQTSTGVATWGAAQSFGELGHSSSSCVPGLVVGGESGNSLLGSATVVGAGQDASFAVIGGVLYSWGRQDSIGFSSSATAQATPVKMRGFNLGNLTPSTATNPGAASTGNYTSQVFGGAYEVTGLSDTRTVNGNVSISKYYRSGWAPTPDAITWTAWSTSLPEERKYHQYQYRFVKNDGLQSTYALIDNVTEDYTQYATAGNSTFQWNIPGGLQARQVTLEEASDSEIAGSAVTYGIRLTGSGAFTPVTLGETITFGSPNEVVQLKVSLDADWGTPTFNSATLSWLSPGELDFDGVTARTVGFTSETDQATGLPDSTGGIMALVIPVSDSVQSVLSVTKPGNVTLTEVGALNQVALDKWYYDTVTKFVHVGVNVTSGQYLNRTVSASFGADIDLSMPEIVTSGDYFLISGTITSTDQTPVNGVLASTTFYRDGVPVFGPVTKFISNGNLEHSISTNFLRPGDYTAITSFTDTSNTIFSNSHNFTVAVGRQVVPNVSGSIYSNADVVFRFFDQATGFGMNPNFLKVLASDIGAPTANDHVAGNTFPSAIGSEVNYVIQDYWGAKVYPQGVQLYDTVGVVSKANIVDVGLSLASLKVKNTNSSIVHFHIAKGAAEITQHILPQEIVEFKLLPATYNLTLHFHSRTTGALESTLTESLQVTSDLFYWIRGHDLADIVIDIQNSNSTIAEQFVNVNIGITNTNSYIGSQTSNIIASLNNINATVLGDQVQNIIQTVSNLDSVIGAQTNTIVSAVQNVNSTVGNQTQIVLAAVSNINSTVANQTQIILVAVSNINSTIANQTTVIRADISNLNSSIATQINSLGLNVSNQQTVITNQLNFISSAISNTESNITVQLNTFQARVDNNVTNIGTQINAVSTRITNTESNITTQLNSIELTIQNTNASLGSQVNTVRVLIENNNANVSTQLNNIQAAVNNSNASIGTQLNNIRAVVANTESNITTQFNSLSTQVTVVESNITNQYNAVSTLISNTNTSLGSQVNSVGVQIQNTNASLQNQINNVLVNITNSNASIATQLNTIRAVVANTESNITTQFNSLTTQVTVTESNVTNLITLTRTDIDYARSTIINNVTGLNMTMLQEFADAVASVQTNVTSDVLSATNSIVANLTGSEERLRVALGLVDGNVSAMEGRLQSIIDLMGGNVSAGLAGVGVQLENLLDDVLTALDNLNLGDVNLTGIDDILGVATTILQTFNSPHTVYVPQFNYTGVANDVLPPTSFIEVAQSLSARDEAIVTWGAKDNVLVKSVTLQMRKGSSGAWVTVDESFQTSGTYQATALDVGGTYQFRTFAEDLAGNLEAEPTDERSPNFFVFEAGAGAVGITAFDPPSSTGKFLVPGPGMGLVALGILALAFIMHRKGGNGMRKGEN